MKCFIAATILAMTGSFASAQSYICNMKTNGDGFVSPTIGLKHDANFKSGVVFDRYIDYVHGKPIKARVRKRKNGLIEFKWNINIPANPDTARLNYTAILNPAKNSISLRGNIRHAENHVGGRGGCQRADF